MRLVALKRQERLDIQTLRRLQDRLLGERTALIDQLRAILLDRSASNRQSYGCSSGLREKMKLCNSTFLGPARMDNRLQAHI